MHYSRISMEKMNTLSTSSASAVSLLDADGKELDGEYRRCIGKTKKGLQCSISTKAITDGSAAKYADAAKRLLTKLFCEYHIRQDVPLTAAPFFSNVGSPARPPPLANAVDPGLKTIPSSSPHPLPPPLLFNHLRVILRALQGHRARQTLDKQGFLSP